MSDAAQSRRLYGGTDVQVGPGVGAVLWSIEHVERVTLGSDDVLVSECEYQPCRCVFSLRELWQVLEGNIALVQGRLL